MSNLDDYLRRKEEEEENERERPEMERLQQIQIQEKRQREQRASHYKRWITFSTVGFVSVLFSWFLIKPMALYREDPYEASEQKQLPNTFNYQQWKQNDSTRAMDSLSTALADLDLLGNGNGGEDLPSPIERKAEAFREQISQIKSETSAILGYSYPKDLQRNKIGFVNVFIKVSHSPGDVQKAIIEITQRQSVGERDQVHSSVFTENMTVYDSVDIALIDPNSIIKKSMHHATNQRINRYSGNRWTWVISTTTEKEEVKLILRVSAKTPNNESIDFDERIIPITITIDNRSTLRKGWIYLGDHPEFLITAIFLPIIGFFAKRYFDNKKDEGKKDQSTNDGNVY